MRKVYCHPCIVRQAKLMTLKTKDTDHRLRVKQAEADKMVLKEQVEIKKGVAEKARSEMHEAHACVDALKEKLEDTESALTDVRPARAPFPRAPAVAALSCRRAMPQCCFVTHPRLSRRSMRPPMSTDYLPV